jgi:hypothetical protein
VVNQLNACAVNDMPIAVVDGLQRGPLRRMDKCAPVIAAITAVLSPHAPAGLFGERPAKIMRELGHAPLLSE